MDDLKASITNQKGTQGALKLEKSPSITKKLDDVKKEDTDKKAEAPKKLTKE